MEYIKNNRFGDMFDIITQGTLFCKSRIEMSDVSTVF